MLDVALARSVVLSDEDPDEAPLLGALRERGARAESLSWDDPRARFDGARLTVLRATWGYHRTPDRFATWIREVARRTALLNTADVVLWNMHKRYLLELSERGVPVLPTELVPRRSERAVAAVRAARGFGEVVIKPAISAGSRATKRFAADEETAAEAHLRELTAHEDALVQPYVAEVEQRGERSLVWIDGEITHAFRKSPRFQGEEEGVVAVLDTTDDERKVAQRAVAAVGRPLFYARIDLVTTSAGPMVMELELIEPSLYFEQSAVGLARFADGVIARLR